MYADQQAFERRALKPMACLRASWELVKDDYWLFLGITFFGLLLVMAGSVIIMGPIFCGFHICLFRRERERAISFGDFFQGFEFFVPSLVASLIMLVPALFLVLACYALMGASVFALIVAQPQGGDPATATSIIFSAVGVVVLLALVGSTIMEAMFLFVYPLIVERQLSGWQAIVVSCRAAAGNFWGAIGLVLLIALIQIVGLMACYFGVFFVQPLKFALIALAYRQVFPEKDLRALFDAEDDEDERTSAPMVLPADTGIQGPPPTSVTPAAEPEQP